MRTESTTFAEKKKNWVESLGCQTQTVEMAGEFPLACGQSETVSTIASELGWQKDYCGISSAVVTTVIEECDVAFICVSAGKTLFTPSDDFSEETQAILGANCVERFNKFKEYDNGWDFGRGNSMSGVSISVLEYFLSLFSEFQTVPSLFMTNLGNLQLTWEDRNGKTIELEFFPERIEYYLESVEIEGSVSLKTVEIQALIKQF